MKRFLSIFLAVSLFFNSGFIFSGVKAFVIPIPLHTIGTEIDKIAACYSADKYDGSIDPTLVLQRITALEALKTSYILGQETEGINEDLGCSTINLYDEQLESLRLRAYVYLYYDGSWPLDNGDKSLISNRIIEIQNGISTANERIHDLKDNLKAIAFGYPIEDANGAISDDPYFVREEIARVETFNNELVIALRFWQTISDQEDQFFKTTSISPLQGKPGDTITINGEGLDKAFGVIFANQTDYKTIEVKKENIISSSQIKIPAPFVNDALGKFDVFVFDEYLNLTRDSNNNDFTYVASSEDSCKCPPGQVSFRNRCVSFDVSRASCAPLSAPVCGCDGVTYTNKCEAIKAGLKSYTSGACR